MDIDFILGAEGKLSEQVVEANRVYSLIENILQNNGLVHSLEEYKLSNSWTKVRLNVPATIASYFLFYMVTIRYEKEYRNTSDYILNVELFSTFFEQPRLRSLQLSAYDQVKVLVECGLNLNVGFVWDEF